MVYQYLQQAAQVAPEQAFVIDEKKAYTYKQALDKVNHLARHFSWHANDQWLVYAPDSPDIVFLLLAADAVGQEIALIRFGATVEEIKAVTQRLGYAHLITSEKLEFENVVVHRLQEWREEHPEEANEEQSSGKIVILTTGTTGIPKGAKYSWARLIKQIRIADYLKGSRWLLAYNMNHFAGIQVFLHVLCNMGTLVIPPSHHVEQLIRTIKQHSIEFVSGTPTFWRLFTGMITATDHADLHLRHVTIGGEAVTDDVLMRLQTLFPGIRISQMYVTTELGVCFTVRDNRKGFPSAFLEAENLPVDVKIQDNELHVRSRHGMEEYYGGRGANAEGWFATGDMVRIEGDRVLFMGRKSEIINVGGRKVHPHEVEEVLLRVAGIQGVQVYGHPNPITGHIVGADVQLLPGYDPEKTKKQLNEACADALDRYKRPRLIRFVDVLPMANNKILRKTKV